MANKDKGIAARLLKQIEASRAELIGSPVAGRYIDGVWIPQAEQQASNNPNKKTKENKKTK